MDDKQRDRLAELRAADVERETKTQEEADLRELEARELQATLEAKGLKRGADFEIINNPLGGVYALKKPDTKANRNWEQADEKKRTNLEWQIGILRHYIIDPAEMDAPGLTKRGIVWSQSCAQRPGLCWQTAGAFVDLMGLDREGLQKK